MISDETYAIVKENAAILDSAIIYDRDFHYNLSVGVSNIFYTLLIALLKLWIQDLGEVVPTAPRWQGR